MGDCLIAAAFLSYMGPFLTNYRDEIINQIWIRKVRRAQGLQGSTWGVQARDRAAEFRLNFGVLLSSDQGASGSLFTSLCH